MGVVILIRAVQGYLRLIREGQKSVHKTAKVRSFMGIFWRDRKVSIELLRSAVLEAHHTGGDRKVSIKLLRYAVLWGKKMKDRKVSIELLRSAVIGSVHRTAEVRSSIHTKKVSIKLPRSAVLWTL